MRALAFLPPELVEEGFEELLATYYDPISVILGPERVHLLEMFIAYFQSQWLENPQIAMSQPWKAIEQIITKKVTTIV